MRIYTTACFLTAHVLDVCIKKKLKNPDNSPTYCSSRFATTLLHRRAGRQVAKPRTSEGELHCHFTLKQQRRHHDTTAHHRHPAPKTHAQSDTGLQTPQEAATNDPTLLSLPEAKERAEKLLHHSSSNT